MGRGSGGCYTGRDSVTGELNARRRTFDKVREPPYAASEVPKCDRSLAGSVIVAPPSRQCWFHSITEMLLLCNEAAHRFAKHHPFAKKTDADGVQSKPLGLEYMADRLDTDDPIWGYMVRREREGWLQGFITMTNFTIWHKDFEWNSLVRESAISDEEKRTRVWDSDNSLATELQAVERKGDPDGEGIIFKRVAEVSLLGALGCGSQLVQLVIEQLEAGEEYDYVVLQATENAIGFYENMGFKRVGAIAAPDKEAMAEQAALASARAEERARAREKEREEKKSNKKEKLSFRTMQSSYAVLQHMSIWIEVCAIMLQAVRDSFMQSSICFWCPEIESSIAELDAYLEERRKIEVNVDQSHSLTGTTHVVDTLWKCLSGHSLERPIEAQKECTRLLQSFSHGWTSLRDVCAGGDAEMQASVSGAVSTFYVYVDAEWQHRHGFKLFEVFHGSDSDKGSHKNMVQAKEWTVSKKVELHEGFDPARLCFACKSARPYKLSWTPRRNLDGERQTEFVPVEITRNSLNNTEEGLAATEYVCVSEQGRKVALAYVKLFAVRAIEANERQVTSKSTAKSKQLPASSTSSFDESQQETEAMSDTTGPSGDDSAPEGMSTYEMERQRRIQENSRILQASGIMEASQQVSSLAASAQSARKVSGSTPQPHPKRARESAADGDDLPKRTLRARVCKSDSDSAMVDGGRVDSSMLSESETPVKRGDDEELSNAQLVFDGAEAEGGGTGHETSSMQCVDEVVKKDKNGFAQNESGLESEKKAAVPFPEDGLYIASENETPRAIANKFGVDPSSLVQMNKGTYAGLASNSKLRRGTLLTLPRPGRKCEFVPSSKLPEKGGGWSAYCHWTYPDQLVEDLFPSYMMARKLNRARDKEPSQIVAILQERQSKIPPPIRSSKEMEEIEAQEALLAQMQSDASQAKTTGAPGGLEGSGLEGSGPGEKWPKDNLYECAEDERVISIAKKFLVNEDQLVSLNKAAYPALNKTAPLRQGTVLKLPPPLIDDTDLFEQCRGPWFEPCLTIVRKVKASRHATPFLEPVDWEQLGIPDYPFLVSNPMDLETVESKLITHKYSNPLQFAADMRLIFKNASVFNEPEDPIYQMANKCLSSFESLWSTSKLEQMNTKANKSSVASSKKRNMYNKVVTVEGKTGHYFVLHYIPDMHWCHLAQMGQYGVFPQTFKGGKPHPHAGQACWKLVPEGEGEELDVSAERCSVAKVTTVNKVQDADKEAWVIHDASEGAPHATSGAVSAGAIPQQQRVACGGPARAGVEPWINRGDEMLRTLTKNQTNCQPFMQLMDVAAPEAIAYYQQIEKPVDLATVWKRLLGGSYATGSKFIAELELVFNNAMAFHGQGSEVYSAAEAFKIQVEKLCLRSTALRPFFYELHPDAKPQVVKKDPVFRNVQKSSPESRQQQKGNEEKSKIQQLADKIQTPEVDVQRHALRFEMDESLDLDTPEAKAMREAQALLVQGPSRTTVSKISGPILAKAAEHQTGKIVKISNILPHHDLERLIKALCSNRSTTRLDLEGCGAGDFGCGLVRGLLEENKRITEIDLQMNQVSDDGAKELARGIPRSGLRELNLGNNDVKREGVQALVEAVVEQGKLTGVMAKLVGLPEELVARVRSKLAMVYREEAQREEQIAPWAAVEDGKGGGGCEMDVEHEGDREGDGEGAVEMEAERQDDLGVDTSKEISLRPCNAGGQRQVPHEEPPFMQIDGAWDGPSACVRSDFTCSPETKLAGQDEAGKCRAPSPPAGVEVAAPAADGVEQSLTQTREEDGSHSSQPIDVDTFCCEMQFGGQGETAGAKLPMQNSASSELSKSSCTAPAPQTKHPVPNRMLWKAECHGLLRRLTKHAKAWPFLEPVDPFEAEAPDYFSVIKRPMDLGTVQHKLDAGDYSGPVGLVSDVELTLGNAMQYNPAGTTVYELAAAMRSVLDTLCTESRSLGAALQKAREKAKQKAETNTIDARTSLQSSEGVTISEAQALLVQRPSKTTVSKVSESVLSKATAHQTGKIVKISNILPQQDLERLFKALCSNRSTTRLDLEGCGAGDFGCGLVRGLLEENKRITEIDLQMNQVSDDGAKELARGIPRSGLRELNLGNNDVKREGVQALVEAVVEQGKLTGVMAKLVGLPEELVARVQTKLVAAWREEACQRSTESGTEEEEECEEECESYSEVVSQGEREPRQPGPAPTPASTLRTEILVAGSLSSGQDAGAAAAQVSERSLPPSQPLEDGGSSKKRDEMLWKAECHGLLRRLTKHAKAWPFLEPVDPFEAEAPDYFSVIKRPMDLGTVQHKLDAGDYSGPVGLVSDVELTLGNAMQYNPAGTTVYELAAAMRSVLDTLCTGSRSLGAALESVRKERAAQSESVDANLDVAGLANTTKIETAEAQKVREAQALLVQASSRTSVSKVSAALLERTESHRTGKIVKISNILPQQDLERLFKALCSNRSTTRLDLEGCGAGDFGCGLVRGLLEENKRITEIDLQMNQVSDDGAKELARGIPRSGLRELNLGNNDVKREGVQALVEAVVEQGKLTGVMAKLVGLPEELVARVRSKLAMVYREEAQREEQIAPWAAVEDGKGGGGCEMDVEHEGDREGDGEGAVEMEAERQDDLCVQLAVDSDGGQRQVLYDESLMQIDGNSEDDPCSFARPDFMFASEQRSVEGESDLSNTRTS